MYISQSVSFTFTETYSLVSLKISLKDIYSKIRSWFGKEPEVYIKGIKYRYKVDETGKKVKEAYFTEFKKISFFSWRDISGTFAIEKPRYCSFQKFLHLEVLLDIQFADDSTNSDYDDIKKKVLSIIQNPEELSEIEEIRTFSGYSKDFLVNLSSTRTTFYSRTVFLVFIFLCLGVIYIISFNILCDKKVFVIKKIVSTRKNLLDGENSRKYSEYKPAIMTDNEMIIIEDSEAGKINEKMKGLGFSSNILPEISPVLHPSQINNVPSVPPTDDYLLMNE